MDKDISTDAQKKNPFTPKYTNNNIKGTSLIENINLLSTPIFIKKTINIGAKKHQKILIRYAIGDICILKYHYLYQESY